MNSVAAELQREVNRHGRVRNDTKDWRFFHTQTDVRGQIPDGFPGFLFPRHTVNRQVQVADSEGGAANWALFVSKSFDGIQSCGGSGGVKSEQDSNSHRNKEGQRQTGGDQCGVHF